LAHDGPLGKQTHLNILLTSGEAQENVQVMGFEALQPFELTSLFGETGPLQGPADSCLERQFNHVTVEIHSTIESSGTKQCFGVGETGTGECLQVGSA